MTPFASIWDNLPDAIQTVQPMSFEAVEQDYGFMLYSTTLIGHKNGRLTVYDIHDYATVFLNGKYIGVLDRREGINSIDLPESDVKNPYLEILVEGMGRINFAHAMIDHKGITDRVVLNGMTLMNWNAYSLPMKEDYVATLKRANTSSEKPGMFFKGIITPDKTADTFIDMRQFKKGIVWVNGHNLGRYWEIGPQYRLYCPASWLKEGENEIIIFDLLKTDAGTVSGFETME